MANDCITAPCKVYYVHLLCAAAADNILILQLLYPQPYQPQAPPNTAPTTGQIVTADAGTYRSPRGPMRPGDIVIGGGGGGLGVDDNPRMHPACLYKAEV
jgi:hypothetical protein